MSGEVVLYQRPDGTIYVSSFSRNGEGWLIVNGWYRGVPADASDAQLGSAVQEGMRAGDDPVDIPASAHEQQLKPLLKAAGTKSFTAFAKDTRAAGMSRTDAGGYSVIPMRNPNRSRGNSFLDIVEKELTVPAGVSVEELARAARAGLRLSVVAG